MIGKLITLIYFYLISAISIILIIIGIYSTVTFALNTTQYETYPLRYFSEDCDNAYLMKVAPPGTNGNESSTSAQEQERFKKECLTRQELQRKQNRIEDLRNSIVFTVVGLVLFIIHFPTARRIAQEK